MLVDLSRGSQQRRELMQSPKVKHIITNRGSNLCFVLTDGETIFSTGLQTFVLRPIEVPGNLWERRLHKVREEILCRKIKDINQLNAACWVMRKGQLKQAIEIMRIDMRWYT